MNLRQIRSNLITACKDLVTNHKCVIGTAKSGKAPTVEAYLFIFLKFIQSVIPTIDYDFTMSVSFNLAKQEK